MKGRKPPTQQQQPVDHAAALADRLGRVAYEAMPDNEALPWEQITEAGRAQWRAVGQAVMSNLIRSGASRGSLEVASVYGAETQQPYVDLWLDTSPTQMSPAKAREVALMLLEAADAAESDAALAAFAHADLGLDDEGAARLVGRLRRLREQKRGPLTKTA